MSERDDSLPDEHASSGQSRFGLLAALLFALSAAFALLVVARFEDHRLDEARAQASDIGHAHLRLISERLNASLSATYALAALVRQGRGQIEHFEQTATELLRLYPGVAAVQLAPGGVIREIVPRAGNERAIGHDLLKDPQRTREAFLAVQSRKLTLAGPFPLVQGGVGAVGRLPVFLPQAGDVDQFWGFTSVLLRFPDVLAGAGLDHLPERGYDYALWRRPADADAGGGGGEVQIIDSSGGGVPAEAVQVEMGVPNGRWILSLAPRTGWLSASELWLPRGAALAGCMLFALAIYWLMTQPARLRREVARRTRALRDSEARFRTVVRTIPDLIWLKDPQGVYLSCNRRFEDFFGAPVDKIVGKTDADFVSPAQAAAFRAHDQRAIAAGVPTSVREWITFASDGHRELLETIKTPMLDSDGRLVGVLGVGRDITELHRLAESYRASEQRLNAGQRVAGIASWERDLETGAIYWSEEVFRLLELDPAKVVPAYRSFILTVHPDDRERVEREYAEARNQRMRLEIAIRLLMPDGRIKQVEMRADFPPDERGVCRRVIGTLQDVTRRNEAELRIRRQEALTRAMLSAMPVGVAITDPRGAIIECNEACGALLRLPRASLVGRRFCDLGRSPGDGSGGAGWDLPDCEAVLLAGMRQDLEVSLEHTDGSVHLALSAVPVGQDGLGVVVALVDLRARKEAEAALRDTAQRIEALNRRFALASEAGGIGVWELDIASRRLDWDETMLRLHGQRAGEFDGTVGRWLECILHFDRSVLALALERAERGEDDLEMDFRVPGRGGDLHFLRASARAVAGADGRPERLTGVCLDMTTLKRSEQILIQERKRYRDLVDSTEGIVWEADAASAQFTYVSRHAERLLGYPLDDWYEPGFWARRIHPEDRSWATQYCATLTARLEPHSFEYRMVARDGRVLWLRDIVTVVAEEGVAKWIRGVMVDITEARHIGEALAKSEEQLSLAIEGAGLGLWDWDIAGGVLDIGGHGLAMLGYGEGEVDTRFSGWEALIHPDDLAGVRHELVEHLQGRSPRFVCEYRLRHKTTGTWIWVHGLGQVVLRDDNGNPLRASGIQLDITERRVAEERARLAAFEIDRLSARNALLLRSAGEGIFGVDLERRCIFVNPMALDLLGLEESEVLHQSVGDLFQHRHDDGRPYTPDECPIMLTLRDGATRQVEDTIARRDGRLFSVRMTVTEMREAGERVGVEVVFQDISERRAMERELQRLATTDPLTGVTNRRQFMERCEHELDRFARFGDPVSLLMIDVDFFKRVNDTYGHAIGDAVLKHLSALGGQQLRRTDVFARLGGEEFAFLLTGSELAGAMEFAARFRSIVEAHPAPTPAGEIAFTISIGAAQADSRDQRADDLLRRADAALYRAKGGGRNRVEAEVAEA